MAFPLFSNFPLELQLAIWALSIPDPEPEVCIAWPLTLYDWEDEQPAQPFTVDTSWPAAAHVCRTARAAVLSPSLIRLRHSPTANLAVPFRTFNPAIDTLYWCHNQKSSMRTFLQAPQNQPLALALRHLAISIRATYPLSDITELIHQHATDLHTLSLVVPDSSPTQPLHATIQPPPPPSPRAHQPPKRALPTSRGGRSPGRAPPALAHPRDNMPAHVHVHFPAAVAEVSRERGRPDRDERCREEGHVRQGDSARDLEGDVGEPAAAGRREESG
jgi:hypothetical protein